MAMRSPNRKGRELHPAFVRCFLRRYDPPTITRIVPPFVHRSPTIPCGVSMYHCCPSTQSAADRCPLAKLTTCAVHGSRNASGQCCRAICSGVCGSADPLPPPHAPKNNTTTKNNRRMI
jgi:hypothetical protein